MRITPSPVVALNRAVAVGQRDGPEAGLVAVKAVMARGNLDHYQPALMALADAHERLGDVTAAKAIYREALGLATQPAERRFIQRRL